MAWHARVPADVARLARTAGEQAVLLRMYLHADRAGRVRIGTRQLARDCHLAPGTVTRALAALRASGAVERIDKGSGTAASTWQLRTVLPVDNGRRSVSTGPASVSTRGTHSVSNRATVTSTTKQQPYRAAAVENHPLSDDGTGTCLACGLAAGNARHRRSA